MWDFSRAKQRLICGTRGAIVKAKTMLVRGAILGLRTGVVFVFLFCFRFPFLTVLLSSGRLGGFIVRRVAVVGRVLCQLTIGKGRHVSQFRFRFFSSAIQGGLKCCIWVFFRRFCSVKVWPRVIYKVGFSNAFYFSVVRRPLVCLLYERDGFLAFAPSVV